MSFQLVVPSVSKVITPKSQKTLNNTTSTFFSQTFPALKGLNKDFGG